MLKLNKFFVISGTVLVLSACGKSVSNQGGSQTGGQNSNVTVRSQCDVARDQALSSLNSLRLSAESARVRGNTLLDRYFSALAKNDRRRRNLIGCYGDEIQTGIFNYNDDVKQVELERNRRDYLQKHFVQSAKASISEIANGTGIRPESVTFPEPKNITQQTAMIASPYAIDVRTDLVLSGEFVAPTESNQSRGQQNASTDKIASFDLLFYALNAVSLEPSIHATYAERMKSAFSTQDATYWVEALSEKEQLVVTDKGSTTSELHESSLVPSLDVSTTPQFRLINTETGVETYRLGSGNNDDQTERLLQELLPQQCRVATAPKPNVK